jgi:L-lactate dehydrogenase complex protein LldG
VADARSDIFARLKGALDAGSSLNARRAGVAARLARPVRTEAPGRVQHVDPVETFTTRAEELGVTVRRVADLGGLGAAVAEYLRAHNLPQVIRTSPELADKTIVWPGTLTVTRGGTEGDDPVGVALARAGVAETGTVIMASGADAPTKLNYLPETHIVVVAARDIVGTYEEGLDRVRGADKTALLPRTVNWISGPSRTADIEQTILVGVHGPKRIAVVIVDEDIGSRGEVATA